MLLSMHLVSICFKCVSLFASVMWSHTPQLVSKCTRSTVAFTTMTLLGTTQKYPLSSTVALRHLVPFFFHLSLNRHILQLQYADTGDYKVKGVFMRYIYVFIFFLSHVMFFLGGGVDNLNKYC